MQPIDRRSFGPCALLLVAFAVFPAAGMAEVAEPAGAWQPGFSVAPYGWLAGLDGTLGSSGESTGGGGIDLPPRLDVSTDEEWTEIGMMFYGEWRGERWTAFFDSVWANVSQDADIRYGNVLPGSRAEATFDGNIYQVGLGYRVFEDDRSFLTVYGGGRYYDVEADTEFTGGVLPDKLSTSTTRSWRDAVFGARWNRDFGSGWSTFVMVDYGFGDSESVWQAFANVGYQFSWGKLMGGYRYMNLDYETDSYKINLALSGPVLGVAFDL